MPDLWDTRRPLGQIRDEVVEQLTLNFAHDNLRVEQFEDRMSRATAAATPADLMMLVQDLPRLQERPKASPGFADVPGVRINRGPVQEDSVIVAIMSGSTRKGLWKAPRRLHTVAFMGGVELDFTNAEVPPEGLTINVFAMMGGLDITVPPTLNVDCSVIPFMGGAEDKTGGMKSSGGPVLHIRGVAFMGGVTVKPSRRAA